MHHHTPLLMLLARTLAYVLYTYLAMALLTTYNPLFLAYVALFR